MGRTFIRLRISAALVVAAVLGVAAVAAGPITMSGVYRTTDGKVTMTFGANGQMDGQSPTGVHVRDTFVIKDNTFTVTAAKDHPVCPSAVGVYTLTEDDKGVITMKLVSDACKLRSQGMNGGKWKKVE
jgi:hypothetical protein